MKMGKNMLVVVGDDTLLGVTCLYLLTANDNRDFNLLTFQFIERGFQFFPLRRAWSVGLNRIIFRLGNGKISHKLKSFQCISIENE